MKKLFMLASAALMVMSLNSCSSDDNGGGVSEAKLVGKWEFSKQKFSAQGQALPEEDYDDNEPGCSKDYLQFNADGTAVDGDYWSSECDLDTTAATWALDGKDLTVNEDGDVSTWKVESVSSTKLIVKTSYTEGGVTWTEKYTLLKAAQ